MNRRRFKIAAFLFAAAAVLLIAIFSTYMIWEQAPVIEPSPQPLSVTNSPSPTEDTGSPFITDRKDGVFTMLLVGNDDGNGNTDTIIVGRLNTKLHTADFVNIPRDTLINENWNIRKINAVYWSDINSGGNGIDALRHQLKRLLGFDIDCYAVIDLNVFVDLVDTMGGVYFDVPQALNYEDPWQDLYIHIEPGYQLLDGYNAMGLCRYRSGYIDGDIGRINMQQSFLKACARQFTELGKIPNISAVISLLSEELSTNMSAANIAYFLRQALMCDGENIRFHTAPTTPDIIHGYSYAVLELAPWIQMINEVLNPYSSEVSSQNLDIVYKDGSAYYSTGAMMGSDYYLPPPAPSPAPVQKPIETTPPAPTPEIFLPDPVLPSLPPESSEGNEDLPEMEIPGSIGNIILDY